MDIALVDATKFYGKTHALDRVDLTPKPGEINAVVGFNGAGKSTLLAALATAAGLRSGDVLLDGEPLRREDGTARRHLFWLPDEPHLTPAGSPITNIATYLDAYGIDAATPAIAETVLGHLDALQIERAASDFHPTSQLSRGQRDKTALAALFSVDADIWLLDEPFASGLDAPATNLLRKGVTLFT